MIKTELTRDQLEIVVRNQLEYDKNIETRPLAIVLKDIPRKAIRSCGLTVGMGVTTTFLSSVYSYQGMSYARADVREAFIFLSAFSLLDFTVNETLTLALQKRRTEHWMSAVSGGTAGLALGYILSRGNTDASFIGGAIGALYGFVKNTPLEFFGFEPF